MFTDKSLQSESFRQRSSYLVQTVSACRCVCLSVNVVSGIHDTEYRLQRVSLICKDTWLLTLCATETSLFFNKGADTVSAANGRAASLMPDLQVGSTSAIRAVTQRCIMVVTSHLWTSWWLLKGCDGSRTVWMWFDLCPLPASPSSADLGELHHPSGWIHLQHITKQLFHWIWLRGFNIKGVKSWNQHFQIFICKWFKKSCLFSPLQIYELLFVVLLQKMLSWNSRVKKIVETFVADFSTITSRIRSVCVCVKTVKKFLLTQQT